MKISTTMVQKLIITDVPNLDPVSVYLEDQGPACGKVTITCFNDSWSYFWGSMGEGNDIRKFFLSCDEHYLARKFDSKIDDSVDDPDALVEAAKKEIIADRRDGSHTKLKARELWASAEEELYDLWHEFNGQGGETYRDLMYDIFGDEFWYKIPKMPNYKYEYLCRIINTVKAALQEAS